MDPDARRLTSFVVPVLKKTTHADTLYVVAIASLLADSSSKRLQETLLEEPIRFWVSTIAPLYE